MLIDAIPKFAHISGYIRDTLHWFPIQQRVHFKILSLMRNCLVGVAPSYLRSFCTFVSSLPARASLRSSTPSAWNSLPQSLRLKLPVLALSPFQFHRRLKTFLFLDAGTDAGPERC